MVVTPIKEEEMEADSIYLDGAVRGTVINVEKNCFSFDHHGEGTRFDKTSTAYQVTMAANQGLDFDNMNIYVSSVDCDSVLATMVALNPSTYCNDPEFVQFIQNISRVDNGGFPSLLPGEATYLCFFSLEADSRKGEEETTELLMEKVRMAEKMFIDGSLYNVGEVVKEPGVALTLDHKGEMISSTCNSEEGVSFEEVYTSGTWGVLVGKMKEDGSRKVTVGKKPFAKVRDLNGLWAHLNKFEDGWGGADSIGGSPFQGGTKLPVPDLLNHIQTWVQQ